MESVTRFWSHEAQNIRCVREADFDRVTAERDALQAELTKARELIDALTKGFNTLEQVEGKYRINMQFANRDDAWTAYSALVNQSAPAAKDGE